MKHINRIGNIASCLLLLAGMAACTAGDIANRPEHAKVSGDEDDVPVTLRAGSHNSPTKAVINEGDTFSPLLLCSNTQHDYTTLRWQQVVDVAKDGKVAYRGDVPVYPHYGDFVYVTGLYPQPDGADLTDGKATWTLDGTTDLMYAVELAGNRWDGFRIYGNTEPDSNRVMAFEHQLTQIRFCAVRTANTIGSNEFRILRITLRNVPHTATLPLDGTSPIEANFSFGNPGDLDATLYEDKDTPGKTVLVTSTDSDKPDAVGYALLPAAGKYIANIETSLGNFLGRVVKADDDKPFQKGYANRITLWLSEDGLSITGVELEDWIDEDGGDVSVN